MESLPRQVTVYCSPSAASNSLWTTLQQSFRLCRVCLPGEAPRQKYLTFIRPVPESGGPVRAGLKNVLTGTWRGRKAMLPPPVNEGRDEAQCVNITEVS